MLDPNRCFNLSDGSISFNLYGADGLIWEHTLSGMFRQFYILGACHGAVFIVPDFKADGSIFHVSLNNQQFNYKHAPYIPKFPQPTKQRLNRLPVYNSHNTIPNARKAFQEISY